MTDVSSLITPQQLLARMGDPSLRIVDASWHLDNRDGRTEYEEARIPGAVFLDIDAVSDPESDLPHMLPTPADFARQAGGLGLSDADTIVVYDSLGLFSSARVWWMLRHMGASDVKVLDGGLPRWRAEGLPVTMGPASPPAPAVFTARPRSGDVADLPAVLSALSGDAQIVDARAAARFRGETAEPRPGLRSGHMPGALNLPFKDLLAENGTMRPLAELEALFTAAGLDLNGPIITSCGSGVTAAILTLALAELGRDSSLYDGSWAEWGGRSETPVAVE